MEQIKQEIINNIYENGENLITGPILQTVLLDMVDDFNSKVGDVTASTHTHENKDILDGITGARTASWDSASEWVENNAPNLVTKPELEGYATEQWVEDQGYLKEVPEGYATEQWVEGQGYLKEVPEGYATTESLNDLSESISQSIADIPAPDLSNYATKPELNEATESVKEWVENKHYLTTASLSGSVTEETVGFMINDATASVKNWVENQNYATETFVSQAIAEIPGTDLTGYATEQWVEEQGYLKEHQDISGLATTESVTSLSESVAQDFANLNIPDVSGLATTESVNQLSESIAQTIEDLPQTDLSGYVTTASYNADSASFDERINNITGSEADLSGYATTASVNSISQSISQSIDALAGNLNDKAEAKDVTSLSESVASDVAGLSASIAAITGSDLSGYATTESVNNISASFAETIDNIPGTDLTGYATEQWVENQGYLTEHQDISGLATTSSLNSVSQSLSASIAAIPGGDVDLSGYATTESVNQLSESIAQELETKVDEEGVYNILAGTGLAEPEYGEWTVYEAAKKDELLETSSSLSASIAAITGSDLSGYVTTASYNADSASFDQRINSITGSGSGEDTDLRNFLFGVETQTLTGVSGSVTNIYSNVSSDTTLGFDAVPEDGRSLGITIHNVGTGDVTVTLPDSVVVGGTTYNLINNGVDNSGNMSIPASEYGDIVVTRNGTDLFVRTSIDVSNISGSSTPVDLSGYATTSSVNQLSESVAADIEGINGNLSGIYHDMDSANPDSAIYSNLQPLMQWVEDPNDPEYGMWTPGDFVTTASFENASASFDSRINNIITGSGVDLSGYATTESVNNLSASFDQRINDIPRSDVDLSGYATTESVNTLSASFAETIDNIPTGSGASGNYLPLTGGTLTGNLKVNASVGVGTNPQGNNSLAVGNSSTNTNNAHYSLAVGENCKVGVYGGVALGRETSVEGNAAFGVATGFRNRVTSMAGYAGGCRSTASANFAFAAGFGAEAASLGQVVLGSYNVVDRSSGTGSYAVILGNGKSSTWNQDKPGDITRSNGLAIKWDGGIDIDYSGSTITLQDKLAELEAGPGDGYVTTESLNEALSKVGVWERGEGSSSAVLSGSLGRATGNSAVVMGGPNVASGHASVAEGQYTTASGEFAHAEGHLSQANGNGSHAEGTSYTAGTASYAHAENRGYALGAYSHAEGSGISTGEYSHAEGNSSKALKAGSHAEGFYTIADNEYEHASGRFNFTSSNQIFSVGIGQSEGTRKNAISIITGSGETPSASVFIYGIGGYDGRNPEPGTNDLATVLNSITSSGSPADLSGYATTESVNTAVGQVDNRVTNLSASFDQRIDEIVAASGGVDPSNFAKAPSILYQTDGSTGLVGVNMTSSTAYVISDEAWQLENLDLSVFDRIDCYFKHSSPRIVTVVLDDVTLDSTFGAYVEKASVMTLNVKPSSGDTVKRTDLTRKWVAVDSTKTKLQVAVNTDNSDLLYKIVGYPKIV